MDESWRRVNLATANLAKRIKADVGAANFQQAADFDQYKLKAELLQLTANYALQAGTINQSLSVPIYHPLSSPSRIRVLQPSRQFPVSLSISQSVDASNYLICFAATSIFLSCKGVFDSILCFIHCITVISTFADFKGVFKHPNNR